MLYTNSYRYYCVTCHCALQYCVTPAVALWTLASPLLLLLCHQNTMQRGHRPSCVLPCRISFVQHACEHYKQLCMHARHSFVIWNWQLFRRNSGLTEEQRPARKRVLCLQHFLFTFQILQYKCASRVKEQRLMCENSFSRLSEIRFVCATYYNNLFFQIYEQNILHTLPTQSLCGCSTSITKNALVF